VIIWNPLSDFQILLYHRCGPCLLMAPEFEAAAQELKGKVRFVKLDTDKDETMAARLNIMGLPTLLFLGKYEAKDGGLEDQEASAVLKGRIEGALRKDNIVDLCNHYFFDGPAPKIA
jgi:thiol-disulfide isomerase/thioredoxin